MDGGPTLEGIARGSGFALCAAGSWTAGFAPALEQMVGEAEKLTGSRPDIFIDVSRVSKLDTFGAWLISATTTAASVLAPRLMVKEPAIGQYSIRATSFGIWLEVI